MSDSAGRLRLHRFLPFTRAEGPGDRACLWVQGCPIRCAGCAVPWTWDEDAGEWVDVDDLAARVLAGPTVEGITFLGGEPFVQAAALARLGERLRAEGLSVMTFTGYTLEALRRARRADYDALLAVTDLLMDGPFVQSRLDLSRPWVGSANQRFHFLTERYRHLEAELASIPNRLEIRLHPDGRFEVNGMITQAGLHALLGPSDAKSTSR
ncbi:MAG TPA: 4Fe-4S single cluster domain-containing protein [Longimicrobium sp.]|nr:4Fe-4S single cluster domain-containing protein [Longimicrobium sp.]